MERDQVAIKAWIISGSKKMPIDTKFASKYSVWVKFAGNRRYQNGAEFSDLLIKMNGETFELGRCNLIAEPNIEGYAGRLVLTGDFHDLESLFFKHKTVKLQTAFFNLKLLLEHKTKIKKAFKDYVADLAYDLSIYRNLFDTLDTEYESEPENVKEVVQHAVLETEGRNFMKYLDGRLTELEGLVSGLGRTDRERHGFYFRRQLWNTIMCSPIQAVPQLAVCK